MNLIFANYGNDSIALIQFAHLQGWQNVAVISVDTGFAAHHWPARVEQAESWTKTLGFKVVRLTARPDFSGLVRAQGEFPTPKFQWCSVYLKGDTLRRWLSHHDPLCEATIMLARRRAQSSLFFDLPPILEGTPEYQERTVCHPLYQHSDEEIRVLVAQTPLSFLNHRSLECDPCVNSNSADRARLKPGELARLKALEAEMGQPLFDPTAPPATDPSPAPFIFDMGCGSPYGCGL